jgi:hypothetical protein
MEVRLSNAGRENRSGEKCRDYSDSPFHSPTPAHFRAVPQSTPGSSFEYPAYLRGEIDGA